MSNNLEREKKRKISRDHRVFAKNSIFAFLITYSNYFGAMITSFFLARLVSQEMWGFLIIATSVITITSLILAFLPPGLDSSLNYYIPRYLALNQINKLKSYIKTTTYIKLISVTSVFLGGIFIFIFFKNLFRINLNGSINLLFVLSPLIFINGLDKFLSEVNRSLNLFNIVFILTLFKFIINISALIFLFIFFGSIQIETIAIINVISITIPFIANCFIIFFVLKLKYKRTNEEKLTFKEIIKNSTIYGSHISTQSFITMLYNEFQIQSIGILEAKAVVTGFNIANHYREVSTGSVGSINKPLTIAFSGLYSTEKYDQIAKTYQVFFHYSLFIILIITGFLYFLGPLFLFLIYGESYLEYTIILRLMIIIVIFGVQGRYFDSLLKASDKVKYLVPFNLVMVTVRIAFFLLGLIYFGIIGALIGIMCFTIFGFIITTFYNYKFFEIKLSIVKTILQYLFFFCALLFSLFLGLLFLNNLTYLVFKSLNLEILSYFEVFSFLVFLLLFFMLCIYFKIVSVSDINLIESFFDKETKFHRIIRKGLRFLKKCVRN